MKTTVTRTSTITRPFLIVLLIVMPALSIAQEQRPAEQPQQIQKYFASKGCIELGGSMAFMWSQPVTNGKTADATISFSAMPYGGYFIIEGLELGVNPLGITIEHTPAVLTTSAITTTHLSMFFAPSYNFKLPINMFPFVEGLAGYTADVSSPNEGNSTTLGGFSWGGRAGMKLPIVERGILIVGAQYVAITRKPSGQTERSGSNEISVTAGFSVWF